jgi:hypothetical protein
MLRWSGGRRLPDGEVMMVPDEASPQPTEQEWERVPDEGKDAVRKQKQGIYTAETPERREAAGGESDDPDQPAAAE